MYRLSADFGVCQGFGNCVASAPELFELDDNDVVVLLKTEIADAERADAEHAVRSCPVAALTLTRDDTAG